MVVRLLLPPCLCVLPGQMHNRRSAAKPDRIRWASMPLACGFTLGSSSPLRGIATCMHDGGNCVIQMSSSPLRGIATPPRTGSAPAPGQSSSPLRGIATGRSGSAGPATRVSSSPLGGIATSCGEICSQSNPRSSSPSEGSQLDAHPDPHTGLHLSSSPLRGIATRRSANTVASAPESSSPLRGIATSAADLPRAETAGVLITPQRHRNWTLRTSVAWGPRRALIASEEANHQQRPRRRNFEHRLGWPVPASSHSMTSTGQPRPAACRT